jgi:hypothetical protein
MEMTLQELEDQLAEIRERGGATDDTVITFDGSSGNIRFEDEIYPHIYYVFSDYGPGYIVIDLS